MAWRQGDSRTTGTGAIHSLAGLLPNGLPAVVFVRVSVMSPLLLLLKTGIAGVLAAALWNWRDAARPIAGTTLMAAWRWAVLAGSLWTTCWVLTAFELVPGADPLWYLAAVLMLCPSVAILGAKQPMSRVWTPFVIVPLVLVLGWSAAAFLWQRAAEEWQLEAPVIAGFALVLLMTAGNHLPTRFAGPVMLWVLSLVLIVLPVSPVASSALHEMRATLRGVASLMLAAAVFRVSALLRQPWDGATPLDRVWREFRDLFGVAWGRRVQDRMNDLAAQHKWGLRLELEGFVTAETTQAAGTARPATPLSPEQSLQWLLRRFATPEWLHSRLGGVTETSGEK